MPTITSSAATSANTGNPTTTNGTTIQPLSSQMPITNSDGTPTSYFTRWAQQRQIDIGSSVTTAQLDAAIAALKVTGSAPIVVTGTLQTGLTLSFNGGLADLNDVDLSTAPTAGQALAYDDTKDKWTPQTIAGGGGNVVGSDTGPVGKITSGGHRYWKMNNILEVAGAANPNSCLIGELAFYDATSAILPYTNPQASTNLGGSYVPAHLNNGDAGSIYAAANPTPGPTWITVDFGVAVVPAFIGMIINGDSGWPAQMPRTLDWMYSDDGINYTVLQTGVTFGPYSLNVEQRQAVSTPPSVTSQVYPQKFEALNDVSKTAPLNGQVPTWNSADSLWEPVTPSGGGGSVSLWGFSGLGVNAFETPVATPSGSTAGDITASMNTAPVSNFYFNNGAASVVFDFGEAVTLQGIGFIQDIVSSNGTWQMAGSNDNSSFTNLGAAGPLGLTKRSSVEFANTTPYRYYKMTSSTSSSAGYVQQFLFKWLL